MTGPKIDLLKDAMKFVIDDLEDKDRLSIVSFSHDSKRLTHLTRMSPQGRDAAKMEVLRIIAGGGTNITSGLSRGLRVLQDRRQQNATSAVFLLTDGQDGGAYA